MDKEKQMYNDLIEIFDEEYGKRSLITPQNTADKLTAKGYRKASEVAREIFEEIEEILSHKRDFNCSEIALGYEWAMAEVRRRYSELKKKYTEEGK